jgi:hypothetical protein
MVRSSVAWDTRLDSPTKLRGAALAETLLTREERRSLALHAAIAERLRRDPHAIVLRARGSLERMRRVNPHAHAVLSEWALLLEGPLSVVLAVLGDPSAAACELRHATPFSGVLSAGDRAHIYRTFAADETARWGNGYETLCGSH